MPTTHEYLTIVATTDVTGLPAAAALQLEQDVRDLFAAHGFALVPTGWSPDPDTISDSSRPPAMPDDDVLDVTVLDLNPGMGSLSHAAGTVG